MKNTKKVINFSSITEYKNFEKYLEKMAMKGLLLSEMRRNILTFIKTTPRKLTFNVSLFYHTTPFDYPDTEVDKDYRELCEESGWKFCASNELYQIFFIEKDKDVIAIHTDSHEEYRIIKKTFMKTEFTSIPLAIMLLVMGVINIRNFDYEVLLSNLSLFNLVWPAFALIIIVVMYISPVNWLIRNKFNLINGKEFSFTSHNQIRLKNIILLSFIGFYFAFALISLMNIVRSAFPIFGTMLIITTNMVIFLITFLCMKRFKTKKHTRLQNIVFFSITTLVTTIISLSGVIFLLSSGLLFSNMENDKKIDVPERISVLELSDFGTNDTVLMSRLNKQSSIFSPINITYYESLRRKLKNDEVGIADTTYIEGINNYFTSYIFNGYVDKERKNSLKYLALGVSDNTNEISPISDETIKLWNVDKGYYLNEGRSEIIILKENIIYVLRSDVDFSSNEIIDICRLKLGL